MKLYPNTTWAEYNAVWDQIESNGDGILDAKELAAFFGYDFDTLAKEVEDEEAAFMSRLSLPSGETMTREKLTHMLQAMDVDGDGVIRREEFKAVYMQLHPQTNVEQFQKLWQSIDTNGDGELQPEELASYFGFDFGQLAKEAWAVNVTLTPTSIDDADVKIAVCNCSAVALQETLRKPQGDVTKLQGLGGTALLKAFTNQGSRAEAQRRFDERQYEARRKKFHETGVDSRAHTSGVDATAKGDVVRMLQRKPSFANDGFRDDAQRDRPERMSSKAERVSKHGQHPPQDRYACWPKVPHEPKPVPSVLRPVGAIATAAAKGVGVLKELVTPRSMLPVGSRSQLVGVGGNWGWDVSPASGAGTDAGAGFGAVLSREVIGLTARGASPKQPIFNGKVLVCPQPPSASRTPPLSKSPTSRSEAQRPADLGLVSVRI